MDWIFSGIGTFIVGLLLGGGGGGYIGHTVAIRKINKSQTQKLSQKAGDHANQNIVGGDSKNNRG